MNNKAFHFTALNQLTRLALGPAVVLALPIFLTGEQQGYWFAMSSIVAILAFSDMGLSAAVMQCSAHEFILLNQESDANFDRLRKHRLNALLTFSVRRVSFIGLIALPCVFIAGLVTFSFNGKSTEWLLPWILLCFASISSLVLSVILSFLEGCDGVSRIQKIRALIATINLIALIFGLALGMALWSLPMAVGLSTAIGFKCIWKMCPKRFFFKSTISSMHIKSWADEISPLLSRYAASWVGGYVMFQLFTPIVFKIDGALAAGRVGLTIALFTAIFSLSNVWSSYQIPKFAMAVAKRDRNSLNICFSKSIKGSVVSFLTMTFGLIFLIFYFNDVPIVHDRLLGIVGIAQLGIAWLLQLIIHNMAVYLRAFKEEPLLWQTIFAAVHTAISTVLCAYYLTLNYVFIGFLSVFLWFLPAVYLIFCRKRNFTSAWIH